MLTYSIETMLIIITLIIIIILYMVWLVLIAAVGFQKCSQSLNDWHAE